MLLYQYYIFQKLPLYPYSYSLSVSDQLYLRQRRQFHYSLFTAIMVIPEWQYTYDGVSCSLNLLIFVPVLQMKWSLMYLYQIFTGWLSPSSSSQPVGKQGAVVVVWFAVDCFWDLTEMELAGSNVMILLYSGDILLVIGQTAAVREYVTFWQ